MSKSNLIILIMAMISLNVLGEESTDADDCKKDPLKPTSKSVDNVADKVDDVTKEKLVETKEDKVNKCKKILAENEQPGEKKLLQEGEYNVAEKEENNSSKKKISSENRVGEIKDLDEAEIKECEQLLGMKKEKNLKLQKEIKSYEEQIQKIADGTEDEEKKKEILEDFKMHKEFLDEQSIQPQFDKGQYKEIDGGNFEFQGGGSSDGSRNGGFYRSDIGRDGYNFKNYPSGAAEAAMSKEGKEVKEELEKASKAVGKFSNGSSNCTAQVVGGKDGGASYVMTNHHCLQNGGLPRGATVKFGYDFDNKTQEFQVRCSQVVSKNKKLDMALVKCENVTEKTGKITLATKKDREVLNRQKDIYSFTHESGKRTQFTEGKIKGIRNGVVTTDASAREGSSGSVALATVEENGKKVVKAATLRNKRGPLGQRISFEIPMADIVDHLCKDVGEDVFSSIMEGGKNNNC